MEVDEERAALTAKAVVNPGSSGFATFHLPAPAGGRQIARHKIQPSALLTSLKTEYLSP